MAEHEQQDSFQPIDVANVVRLSAYKNEKPYDPEPKRDWVRALVTVLLTVSFVSLVAFACIAAWSGNDHWVTAKEALQILLPAVGSLLGSAIGFYFVSQNKL